MKSLILFVMLLFPSVTIAGEFTLLAAGCLQMHATLKPSPSPTPTPSPSGICSNCRGTGKLGDGTVFVNCPVCGGDGKVDNTPPPPRAIAPVPKAPIQTLKQPPDWRGQEAEVWEEPNRRSGRRRLFRSS